jgi:hypothetical protein
MDAGAHARLTTAVAVAAVGGIGGHVLRPFSADATWPRLLLFVGLLAAVGALRGRQARALRAELQGTAATGAARAAALYAAGTLIVAWLGYALVHGWTLRLPA